MSAEHPRAADVDSAAPDLRIGRRAAVGRLAALAVAAPAILRGRYPLRPGAGREYSARAVRLVEESTAVDMLNQFRFPDFADRPPLSERWLRVPGSFTREEFDAYRTSGVRVFALGALARDHAEAMSFFADMNGFVAGYGDWLARVDDVADFARVRQAGKVGLMLTLQTSDHFRTPDDVDAFFALGQRVSQLTYNFQNRIGSGFLEQGDGGLTVFGASIVERMNAVGMAVDLSHCGDRTTLDALAASKKPPIFTHASCRALLPGNLRAKTDEMIRLLAKSGGVTGVPFIRFMLRDREPVGVAHALDHVDHVARLVGIEHVGVGSDLDLVGNANPMHVPTAGPDAGRLLDPTKQPNFARYHYHARPDGRIATDGLDHPKRMYDLAEGLIGRRYGDADIGLVLGGNWARVLSRIWPA